MKLNLSHQTLFFLASLAGLLPQVIPLLITNAAWAGIALSAASFVGAYLTGLSRAPGESAVKLARPDGTSGAPEIDLDV